MKKINIADITLKKLSADRAVSLLFREKSAIANCADRLGADCIELPAVKNVREDTIIYKTVSKNVKNAALAIAVGFEADSVAAAWECVKDAKSPRLQVELPVSTIQMEYTYHVKQSKMLEKAAELVAAAKSLCADVEFSALDATRADEDFLIACAKEAEANGATMFTICDDAGVSTPEQIAELVGKVNDKGFDAFTLAKDFGPLLDEIDHTQLIGHSNTSIVLKGIFTSHELYSQIGLSETEASDIADSINEKSVVKGYTPLIVSVLDTIDIIKMSTDSNVSNEEMVKKVEVLLADLTTESAELLQEMTSESVMLSKGAPEKSAKPMSDMFSSAFGGLAEAKENGMSDEQYKKEAKAMTDMMNVAMNFENASSSSMFGQSSATGVEANEFVDNVFESTVISGTIIDTVYADGSNASVDPLQFGGRLNEADRNNTVNALNDKWNSATDEQRTDSEYQKTYVAIGALMNMNIGITDSGIVEF